VVTSPVDASVFGCDVVVPGTPFFFFEGTVAEAVLVLLVPAFELLTTKVEVDGPGSFLFEGVPRSR